MEKTIDIKENEELVEVTEQPADLEPVEAKSADAAESAERPAAENDGKYDVEGILELADDGFGFLRFDNFLTLE